MIQNEDFQDEIGNNHIATNAETPLRDDAFAISDDEKIELIKKDVENILRLREVLTTLPPFCRDYFRAIDTTTTTKTRISYAYDIRIFFQFLLEQNPMFKDKTMSDFTVDVLDQVKAVDLEEYEEFLKV